MHFPNKVPFYILTNNPHIIRGNMTNWRITRFGYTSKGRGKIRENNELQNILSRKHISLIPAVCASQVLNCNSQTRVHAKLRHDFSCSMAPWARLIKNIWPSGHFPSSLAHRTELACMYENIHSPVAHEIYLRKRFFLVNMNLLAIFIIFHFRKYRSIIKL